MHALEHVRRGLLQVADDPLVGALVVDLRALEVAGEEIADDPQRQLGLLVDERRRLRGLRARLDRLPEPLQEDEVALDVLGRGALGRGADDDAAFLDVELLDDVLQARALAVVEPARDAEPLALRDEDEEAAGERDLGRQPRALRLHRVLDRLHEDLLAAGDQVGDLLAVPLALELGHDDLVDVEEAVLLEPDLDERGLHPGQDVVDGAEVDVPGDRAALGPLEVDLGDAVVLDDGDALLADVDGDQELALRGRAAARASAATRRAVALLVGAAFLALAALGGLALLASRFAASARASRRPSRPAVGSRDGAGLLAPPAASAAATALRLATRLPAGVIGRRLVCRWAAQPWRLRSWRRALRSPLSRSSSLLPLPAEPGRQRLLLVERARPAKTRPRRRAPVIESCAQYGS